MLVTLKSSGRISKTSLFIRASIDCVPDASLTSSCRNNAYYLGHNKAIHDDNYVDTMTDLCYKRITTQLIGREFGADSRSKHFTADQPLGNLPQFLLFTRLLTVKMILQLLKYPQNHAAENSI